MSDYSGAETASTRLGSENTDVFAGPSRAVAVAVTKPPAVIVAFTGIVTVKSPAATLFWVKIHVSP